MLREDAQGLATHYDTKFVWQALSDFRAWAQALLYICLLVPIYAIALFLPTIINSLGESRALCNVRVSYSIQVTPQQTPNF